MMLSEYPAKIPTEVPPNRLLVHNHVRIGRYQGDRGFRFWLAEYTSLIEHSGLLEECRCGWAPHLPEHYRVASRYKGEA